MPATTIEKKDVKGAAGDVGDHEEMIAASAIKMMRLEDDPRHSNILTPPQTEQKTLASQKSSSNHSDRDTKQSSSTSSGVVHYLESLKEERDQLSHLTDGLTHVFSLIEKEMKRVADEGEAPVASPTLTEDAGMLKSVMPIPVDVYPNYNFVGRILGPRGTTAKQLEATTGCKITVHGRKRELSSSGDAPAAPVNTASTPSSEDSESLRIEISVPANVPGAAQKLEMGVTLIKALLVPPADGHDELKRQQLMVLASMNGTYRPRGAASQTYSPSSECVPGQYQNLLPYGYRFPMVSNCQHETLLKSLLSMGLTPSDASKTADKSSIHSPDSPCSTSTSQNQNKNECTNLKCSVLRSLIEHNVPLSNQFMATPPITSFSPITIPTVPKPEDMVNMMQWCELMNRMRLATSTVFPEIAQPSVETMKAQEIGNRMCSTIGYGNKPAPITNSSNSSYRNRRFSQKK